MIMKYTYINPTDFNKLISSAPNTLKRFKIEKNTIRHKVKYLLNFSKTFINKIFLL